MSTNSDVWMCSPVTAWCTYILPEAQSNPRWIEDSRPISKAIDLSKRELFALILLAHIYSEYDKPWKVGYDSNGGEPNDGFVIFDNHMVRVEHKVIADVDKREVLEAVLSTCVKQSEKGSNYGSGRVLVIHPNKSSEHGGAVKISDLAKEIGSQCNFEQVLVLSLIARKDDGGRTGVFHIVQMLSSARCSTWWWYCPS